MLLTKHRLKYYSNIIQRFYNSANQQLVGKQPSEQLFTQFLDKTQPQSSSSSSPIAPQLKQSNQHFRVGRTQYLKFADQNPLGSILQMTHKQTNLTLLSTSFSSSDVAGMYKSIQKIKPDLVLAQIRPDSILSDFNLIPKRNQVFSDRLYFKQLMRSPFQIMPSADMRDIVTKKIKGRVTMKELPKDYAEEYNRQVEQSQMFSNFISKEFINNYVIGSSAYYCERNNIKMGLCGLPEISERQIIANQFSLMQLQVMFKRSAEQLALYSKVTPRKTANYLFPEVFMNPSDHYISILLEYIIAKGGYKNILVLTGVMENEAIKEYLENRTIGTILETVLPKKPEGTILRQLDNFEVIEKHCLLDVMEYGDKILQIPIEELVTTNKMSDFYGDPHHTDKRMADNVMQFRLDTYTKYLGVMEEARIVGETMKTKDWIRRAIES